MDLQIKTFVVGRNIIEQSMLLLLSHKNFTINNLDYRNAYDGLNKYRKNFKSEEQEIKIEMAQVIFSDSIKSEILIDDPSGFKVTKYVVTLPQLFELVQLCTWDHAKSTSVSVSGVNPARGYVSQIRLMFGNIISFLKQDNKNEVTFIYYQWDKQYLRVSVTLTND